MGRRHNLYLLDSSIPGDLKEDFPRGAATTSTECGLKNDADDMDVIGLAFERSRGGIYERPKTLQPYVARGFPQKEESIRAPGPSW